MKKERKDDKNSFNKLNRQKDKKSRERERRWDGIMGLLKIVNKEFRKIIDAKKRGKKMSKTILK